MLARLSLRRLVAFDFAAAALAGETAQPLTLPL
jgi:hypothetical protein